jgi:uncharacterized membrane protein YkoI
MRRGLLLPLLLLGHPALAASYEDYERARAAVARGEILPLAEILGRVQAELDARMIEVEFEIEGERYEYEFELITRDGRILEAAVDAATGRILAVEEEDDD